jgi:hypothetical protein
MPPNASSGNSSSLSRDEISRPPRRDDRPTDRHTLSRMVSNPPVERDGRSARGTGMAAATSRMRSYCAAIPQHLSDLRVAAIKPSPTPRPRWRGRGLTPASTATRRLTAAAGRPIVANARSSICSGVYGARGNDVPSPSSTSASKRVFRRLHCHRRLMGRQRAGDVAYLPCFFARDPPPWPARQGCRTAPHLVVVVGQTSGRLQRFRSRRRRCVSRSR